MRTIIVLARLYAQLAELFANALNRVFISFGILCLRLPVRNFQKLVQVVSYSPASFGNIVEYSCEVLPLAAKESFYPSKPLRKPRTPEPRSRRTIYRLTIV